MFISLLITSCFQPCINSRGLFLDSTNMPNPLQINQRQSLILCSTKYLITMLTTMSLQMWRGKMTIHSVKKEKEKQTNELDLGYKFQMRCNHNNNTTIVSLLDHKKQCYCFSLYSIALLYLHYIYHFFFLFTFLLLNVIIILLWSFGAYFRSVAGRWIFLEYSCHSSCFSFLLVSQITRNPYYWYASKVPPYDCQWLLDVSTGCRGCSPLIYTLYVFFSCVEYHFGKIWDSLDDESWLWWLFCGLSGLKGITILSKVKVIVDSILFKVALCAVRCKEFHSYDVDSILQDWDVVL